MKFWEALRAIDTGGKIRRVGTNGYFKKVGRSTVDDNGCLVRFTPEAISDEWETYREPEKKGKKIVMRALYVFQVKNQRPRLSQELYKKDADFCRDYKNLEITWFKRLEEMKCES